MFPGIENIEHWGTFVCIKNTLSSKIWEKIPQRGRVYVILYTLGQIIKENYSLCNLIKLHFCFLRFRLSWPPQHLHLAFKQLPLLVFSCLDQFGQHDRVIGRSVTASCYRGGCIQYGLESQCVIGLIGKIESTLHTMLPRTSGSKGKADFISDMAESDFSCSHFQSPRNTSWGLQTCGGFWWSEAHSTGWGQGKWQKEQLALFIQGSWLFKLFSFLLRIVFV